MAIVACVRGLTEGFVRILKVYRITLAMKPHTILRNIFVHPEGRIEDEEKLEMIYKIPC